MIIEDAAAGYFGEGKSSQSLLFKMMSLGVMMMMLVLNVDNVDDGMTL